MFIFKSYHTYLLFHLLTVTSGMHIRFIAIIVGSQNHLVGYERMGSAYDVAVEQSEKTYPAVFQNFSMTRYFVPGNFTCAESDAEMTIGLGKLFEDHYKALGLTSRDQEPEFCVVLSPGCTFEALTLGDFARGLEIPTPVPVNNTMWSQIRLLRFKPQSVSNRNSRPNEQILTYEPLKFFIDTENRCLLEEDVTIIQSTSSLDILNNRKRFPTLLPVASVSYNNVASALMAIMRHYGWSRFNVMCDTNQGDPQFLLMDVSCSIIRRIFQATEISMTYAPFNSGNAEEIKVTLSRCSTLSTITVIASVTAIYEKVLIEASAMGMANGDYVFYLLPLDLFTEFDEVIQTKMQVSDQFSSIIPFVFLLSFDEINWEAVSSEVLQMANLSNWKYSFTVTQELQRNAAQLAAYESVMMLAQILNESLADLDKISATEFTSRFFNRKFDLASRRINLNGVGRRECNVIVKQFHKETGHFESVLLRDSASRKLFTVNNSKIRWSGVAFPPGVVPVCGFNMELCLKQGNTTSMIIGLIVAAIVGFFAALISWKYVPRQGLHGKW